MNDQQRAAMTLALEALEDWKSWDDVVNQYPVWTDKDEVAITALREALNTRSSSTHSDAEYSEVAQPQDNLNCKSVQARLATSWGYVKEQPQGEPVAWMSRLGNVLTAKYMEKYAVGIEKETHTIPLYTTPPSVEAMRIETLEKAAKVCEELKNPKDDLSAYSDGWIGGTFDCAAAIRSMK